MGVKRCIMETKEGRDSKTIHRKVDKYRVITNFIKTGLVNKRSTHAAGVIFCGNPLDTTAIMRSPSGSYQLGFHHDAEWLGILNMTS